MKYLPRAIAWKLQAMVAGAAMVREEVVDRLALRLLEDIPL